jgi:hypothetical protein
LITKLEKEGIVKEVTLLPDFGKRAYGALRRRVCACPSLSPMKKEREEEETA